MSLEKVGQVAEISLPIFALIFLGIWLRRRKILTEDHLGGINWILFNLSLPALLLKAIASQEFGRLYQPAIIVGCLSVIVLGMILYMVVATLIGVRRPLLGPFTVGVFWANASYIGFPLALNAFGEVGLIYAAIANTFVMPAYVSSGIIFYTFAGRRGGEFSLRSLLKSIFNPIINAVILGLMISLAVSYLGKPSGWLEVSAIQVGRVLAPLGEMGLPLALIAVGASLSFGSIKGKWFPLMLSVLGKLMVAPLICYIVIRTFFPESEKEALGVAVLISATPCAIASWVVSRKMNVEPEFVSAQMVISTTLSVFSIPFWLYVLV